MELCYEVIDMDSWGLGYKAVTRKMGLFGPKEPLDAQDRKGNVDELFPVHPRRRARTIDDLVDSLLRWS